MQEKQNSLHPWEPARNYPHRPVQGGSLCSMSSAKDDCCMPETSHHINYVTYNGQGWVEYVAERWGMGGVLCAALRALSSE